MTVKHWNTGTAAMRFRLKNKKKKKAPSSKRQASSAKQQAPAGLNSDTIKLLQKQHDVLVDVIQYLNSTKQSNTLIRSQVDTIVNFEKDLKEGSEMELTKIKLI